MPMPPEDVKYHYMVDVLDNGSVECNRFLIVAWHPYRIQFDRKTALIECDNVGGYNPQNLKKVLNWISDLIQWGEKACKNGV